MIKRVEQSQARLSYAEAQPNFMIVKLVQAVHKRLTLQLQSCQCIDNLNVNKMTFGNFASVKIVDIVNNQNVILNFANFATI